MRFLPISDNLRYHFHMKLTLIILLLVTACGKQGSNKLFPIKESNIETFVNQKEMPSDPNLTLDKAIINNSYPIEIALYKDGQFYYNLANLGDGKGTWQFSDGKIELKAKRTLFNMYIDVLGSDPENKTLTIQFSDRFGPNTLKLMNVNI
jgi:hypothetical protein